ncbi:hypothetical protein VTN02DRAFT_2836 [Thermoascus thermophilus]
MWTKATTEEETYQSQHKSKPAAASGQTGGDEVPAESERMGRSGVSGPVWLGLDLSASTRRVCREPARRGERREQRQTGPRRPEERVDRQTKMAADEQRSSGCALALRRPSSGAGWFAGLLGERRRKSRGEARRRRRSARRCQAGTGSRRWAAPLGATPNARPRGGPGARSLARSGHAEAIQSLGLFSSSLVEPSVTVSSASRPVSYRIRTPPPP